MAVSTEAQARITTIKGLPDYAKPGERLEPTVEIQNIGTQPGTFKVEARTYNMQGEFVGQFECRASEGFPLPPSGEAEVRCSTEMPDEDIQVQFIARHQEDSSWPLDYIEREHVRIAQKGAAAQGAITYVNAPDKARPGDWISVTMDVQNIGNAEADFWPIIVPDDIGPVMVKQAGTGSVLTRVGLRPNEMARFYAEFVMPYEDCTVRFFVDRSTDGSWMTDDSEQRKVYMATTGERPTPPTQVSTITMDEYRQNWQPHGWQLVIIGPTSTWRQDWGIWEAIRDIVQNALDEAETYEWGYDEEGLWISDPGRGIAVADLLLGPPKTKPDYARGKFGEGMKISALTLLREGYSVRVETVGREIWMTFLEQKVDGKAKSLAALWRPDGRAAGTCWHIVGYHGPAYERFFTINLPQDLTLAKKPSEVTEPVQRYNWLIKAERQASSPEGGMIYARDIYMRQIASSFSYNLWGFPMAPDRHGAKRESDVWEDMGRLWSQISDEDLLAQFIEMVTEPPIKKSAESKDIIINELIGRLPGTNRRYTDIIGENAQTWQNAWARVVGEGTVMRTDSALDTSVTHIGYKSMSVQMNVKSGLQRAITTDRDLIRASQERLSNVKKIPDSELSQRQMACLNLARAIVARVSRYNMPEGGVHAAMIPRASDRARTAGMYEKETETIYISPDQLQSGHDTVDTTIHELAHHQSQAEDLTDRHAEALTRIAARVVSATSERAFDKYMTNVPWYS